YGASLIVGATNVPEVLDIARVRPGTLIVDDSGPHCFAVSQAISRLETQQDVLFTEGGALRSPTPVDELVYAPREWAAELPGDAEDQLRTGWPAGHLMGCVFSGLLSARYPDLPPTIGLVATQEALRHLRRLRELGMRAADLHCERYHPSRALVAAF